MFLSSFHRLHLSPGRVRACLLNRTFIFTCFCVFSLVYLYLANRPSAPVFLSSRSLARRLNSVATSTRFVNEISEERLNKLLRVLQQRESDIRPDLQSYLGLISFDDIRNELTIENNQTRIGEFLTLAEVNRTVQVTPKFVKYLRNMSEFFSFVRPRNDFVLETIRDPKRKPALLIGTDFKYFSLVMDALQHIKQYLPDYPLVVYDLGIYSSYMLEQVIITIRFRPFLACKESRDQFLNGYTFQKYIKSFFTI